MSSSRVAQLLEQLLSQVRSGAHDALDEFFSRQRPGIHSELLKLGMELYNEGLMRGRAWQRPVIETYIAMMHEKYDAKIASPVITAAELTKEIQAKKYVASESEIAAACHDIGLTLGERPAP